MEKVSHAKHQVTAMRGQPGMMPRLHEQASWTSPREGQRKELFRVTALIQSHYKHKGSTESSGTASSRKSNPSSVSLGPTQYSIQFSQECLKVTMETPEYRRCQKNETFMRQAADSVECLKRGHRCHGQCCLRDGASSQVQGTQMMIP